MRCFYFIVALNSIMRYIYRYIARVHADAFVLTKHQAMYWPLYDAHKLYMFSCWLFSFSFLSLSLYFECEWVCMGCLKAVTWAKISRISTPQKSTFAISSDLTWFFLFCFHFIYQRFTFGTWINQNCSNELIILWTGYSFGWVICVLSFADLLINWHEIPNQVIIKKNRFWWINKPICIWIVSHEKMQKKTTATTVINAKWTRGDASEQAVSIATSSNNNNKKFKSYEHYI